MDEPRIQPESEFVVTAELFKAQSPEKRFSLTPVLVPDKPDWQGDKISASEIEKAVWGIGLHKNLMDDEHFLVQKEMGMPVEKYVLPADTLFKKTESPSEEVQKTLDQIAKLQADLAKNFPDEIRLVKKGSAMLGVIWKSEVWEQIKKGEKNGLSIFGVGTRTRIQKQ